MLLGADTGFFVAHANNHFRASILWGELAKGQHTLIISTLTVNELLSYFFRRGESEAGREWVNLLIATKEIEILPVSLEIAILSARYRHSLGLPTVDSVILATMKERGCETLLTTDEHFRIVQAQGVLDVEFLL